MDCPVGNKIKECQRCRYGKNGLCDYPYKLGMSCEEIRKITRQALKASPMSLFQELEDLQKSEANREQQPET